MTHIEETCKVLEHVAMDMQARPSERNLEACTVTVLSVIAKSLAAIADALEEQEDENEGN